MQQWGLPTNSRKGGGSGLGLLRFLGVTASAEQEGGRGGSRMLDAGRSAAATFVYLMAHYLGYTYTHHLGIGNNSG